MAQKIKRKKSFYRRVKENKKLQQINCILLPALFGVLLFLLWQFQVLHTWFHTDTFTLPVPSKIVHIMLDNMDGILENSRDTMIVAFAGLIIGSVVGYLIAVLAALWPKAGSGGLKIIGAFASIPVVALAPVLNNWTRDVSTDASTRSMVSKIIVVLLISAANITLNAYRGLTELKPYAEDLMATYAAKKITTLWKLRIPNSIPYVFIALKVAVPASIMTAIVSEYFAEYITGLGRQIRENILLAQYSTAWIYIITACLIGLFSYLILMIIQTIVLKRYH